MPITEPWTITLDGATYYIKRGSYQVENICHIDYKPTARGNLHYEGSGIWKKKFKMVINCENNGVSNAGKDARDALRVSLAKVSKLAFTTPDGDTYNVYNEGNFSESIKFDPAQPLGFEYEVEVSLIES